MYSLLKLPPNRFQKSLPDGKVLHGLTHPAGFRGAGWKTLLITGSYHSCASCVSVDALAVPVEPAPALTFRGLWPPTRVSMQGRISSHWFFGRCCTHYPMQFPDTGILLLGEHMPFFLSAISCVSFSFRFFRDFSDGSFPSFSSRKYFTDSA